MSTPRLLALTVALVSACSGSGARAEPAPAERRSSEGAAGELHGRVERHGDLRLLRLWGGPSDRGYAHGVLLAQEIAEMMRREFAARFASRPGLIEQARAALPRLIEYPEDVDLELRALWRGLRARDVDLHMAALGRAFDETDLRVANALDVFGLMGCSSFTVWGEQVEGGGVLTARNFDWPLTGAHMLEQTLLIVQEHEDGRAVASVAWPGYVGTVTGVSADGVAAYLHVGSARLSLPEPSSWPSAIAARKALEAKGRGAARLAAAEDHIEYTSPPVGYMTHVVLPEVPDEGSPAALFEADARKCVVDGARPGPFVLTNHFRLRDDGRPSNGDSVARERTLTRGLAACCDLEDCLVDLDEAWSMLASVEVGGRRGFGTLHSLVFRHDPWVFELRVAAQGPDGVVAAPSSARRHRLSRAQVFGPR